MTPIDRRAREQPPPPTVLVVDDSATVRAVLRRTLQQDGQRVIEAANGKEAVTYAIIEHPDLVLLDIDMPVMNGLEALEVLQRELAECPVLMLTARTEASEVAAALELGAQDYLRKPCEPVELRARVRKALKIQGQQNQLRRRAEELGEISSHDPLTGLGNRRLMSQWLAERSPTALAALIVDLDFFKRVNDTEGHMVGDRVLIQVAARLSAITLDTQLVIRWGGEEFLMLVPSPDDATVNALGERICSVIRDRPIDIGGGRALPLTVSTGAALGTTEHLADLLNRADGALYTAKNSGRDRFVCA